MNRHFLFIICTFLILFLTGCSPKSDPTMRTDHLQPSLLAAPLLITGSGTNLPVTAKLAEAYQLKTGIQIDLSGSIGSDGAINAVKSGSLELGVISKPLPSIEGAAGIKELPYGQVAIIFGTHLDVPDSNLNDSDIIAILKGKKTTWSNGNKIHVLLRQKNDSSNLVLYDMVPTYKETLSAAYEHKHWQILYRDSDMSEAIKENKGSLGLTCSTEIAKKGTQTKPLRYNGISPTTENIRNGTYPLRTTLSFIYKEPLSSRAAAFLDYVFSEEGQLVLSKWGSSPIGR